MCFLFSLGIINLSKVLSECLFVDGSRRLDSGRGRSFCGRYRGSCKGQCDYKSRGSEAGTSIFSIW